MYNSYSLLTSALDGVSHAPAALYPQGKDPDTHCTGGWVGLRAGLDTEVREKILCPCRGSNLDSPVVQSVVRHYTDWATPAPKDLVGHRTELISSTVNCTTEIETVQWRNNWWRYKRRGQPITQTLHLPSTKYTEYNTHVLQLSVQLQQRCNNVPPAESLSARYRILGHSWQKQQQTFLFHFVKHITSPTGLYVHLLHTHRHWWRRGQ
jgi:hypothetical protein